jgi:ribulose-bisphosphate carboxylase small chain
MRVTQGTFSYLHDFTDEETLAQVAYALGNGWAIAIELTDDPHPRNTYWEMWDLPMFDGTDPGGVLHELRRCREAFPNQYIRVTAYDATLGRQTTALSFIVNRPPEEPGFRVERQETSNRQVRYTIHSYAADEPHGQRYGAG